MTRLCSVEGCGRPHQARGWCKRHHARWLRNGDPSADLRKIGGARAKAPCVIDGCALKAYTRGRCRRHFSELEARIGGFVDATVTERLWMKIDRRPNGCWLWTGAIDRWGYPKVTIGGRQILAYRALYELLVEPIPDGLHIDHLCHTNSTCILSKRCPHRRCVNPAHLEPVTTAENNRRSALAYRLTRIHVA